LLLIYETLDRMDLKDENQNQFRNDLANFLQIKFEYEINSKEYLVAAIFATLVQEKLGFKVFSEGLDSIIEP